MLYCAGNTPPYSMDYLADLTVKESCSILEQTTPTKNGGTASCRSAVFFGSEGEEGRGLGEEGHGTLRREKQGFREDERGLGEDWNWTLRRTKQGL